MKRYRFWEPAEQPDGSITPMEYELTEQQILDKYLDSWLNMAKTSNSVFAKELRQKCIDDFIVVHWAIEVEDD